MNHSRKKNAHPPFLGEFGESISHEKARKPPQRGKKKKGKKREKEKDVRLD